MLDQIIFLAYAVIDIILLPVDGIFTKTQTSDSNKIPYSLAVALAWNLYQIMTHLSNYWYQYNCHSDHIALPSTQFKLPNHP